MTLLMAFCDYLGNCIKVITLSLVLIDRSICFLLLYFAYQIVLVVVFDRMWYRLPDQVPPL